MIHIDIVDLIKIGYALFIALCVAVVATFCIWYYLEIKKPVDKEQNEK